MLAAKRHTDVCNAVSSLPDFIGELLLIAVSDAQLPVANPEEDQQDEDEEQGAHEGADYHGCSVWS